MPTPQIDVAGVAGVVAEGVLYGIYIMLVGFAGYLLVNRKSSGRMTHYPMIVTVFVMFMLVTAQIVVDVVDLFVALFHYDTREERILYMENTRERLFQAKHYILVVMLVVGDAFMAYRCFIIWGRCLWIVIPALLLTATALVFGIIAMTALDSHNLHTISQELSLVTAAWSLSLCGNALSTTLIVFKIWQVDRANKGCLDTSGSGLAPIIRIIIESGALNAACILILIVLVRLGSEALETMEEMATVTVGIITMMLIVRVQINTERELRYSTRRPMTTIRFGGTSTSTGPAALDTQPDFEAPSQKDVEEGIGHTPFRTSISFPAASSTSFSDGARLEKNDRAQP